jgi:hypothetical protein
MKEREGNKGRNESEIKGEQTTFSLQEKRQ